MSASINREAIRETLVSKRGASLAEILVALLIFGMGITMAMRSLPRSNVATSRAGNITKATNFAQAKIEQLMSLEYADADIAAGTHNDPDNPLDAHFTRSWIVADDAPVQDMKTVNVTVSFQTGSADSSTTLSTYISNRR